MKWQPIETAPKDGTVIDLWVKCNSRIDSRVAAHLWVEDRGGWVDFYTDDELLDVMSEKPTHWMHIPEGPSS